MFKNSTILQNKLLREYCIQSTNESIKRLIEKYESKKQTNNIECLLSTNDNINNELSNLKPNLNVLGFLSILSISTLAIYLYKGKY